ncbi:MAG: hypothetical protein PHY08_03870 [Candidatus Cloacimonetes bacterium]|jgi:hypothetical protein|nr:hypothetical protein [Candidatus Cloacimonadota bacterium]MDD4155689.1 hypothetical protein [Candidatus Cloacimonadota bacterium]
MSIKNEKVVDNFLENHNMDFLFSILAKHEAERLADLPEGIKKKFEEKITTLALKHIAMNEVPDYIVEQFEQELSENRNDEDFEYEEEYENDMSKYTDDLESYDDDDDENFEDE